MPVTIVSVAPLPSMKIVLAIGGSAFGPYQKLSGLSVLKLIAAADGRLITFVPAEAPVHEPTPTVVAAESDSGLIVVAPAGVASVGLLARFAA
ncbi:hypothetical protein ELE36_00770 [Pseudolysobacter antarcticus]|uniref:Uncharacterized protein n=1 Tax=Pseudolysobacter antarcticus TaxID=2511995 RepID=A0A411HEW9_9GAMM|nr:hypothetical protein ELE36_00770 [Pseudolysobacter antarcticus]